MAYRFVLPMRVRDYECDVQGIVNNAIYQHYNEHCRHVFIESLGLSFYELHEQGIDVMVANIEMRYKASLRPRDRFEVRLKVEKQGLRYVFHQDIVRTIDAERASKDPSYAKEVLCVRAKTDIISTINGRLGQSPLLDEALGLA